eukprot:scaffold62636_cov52-Attheya_sp.AAC.8
MFTGHWDIKTGAVYEYSLTLSHRLTDYVGGNIQQFSFNGVKTEQKFKCVWNDFFIRGKLDACPKFAQNSNYDGRNLKLTVKIMRNIQIKKKA